MQPRRVYILWADKTPYALNSIHSIRKVKFCLEFEDKQVNHDSRDFEMGEEVKNTSTGVVGKIHSINPKITYVKFLYSD